MNKRAKFAVFGIILSISIAAIFILPFMSKAQAEVSYNNNLASTPPDIKSKIPLTVEKDDNWQVEWHETYTGLTHREYAIAIQNQKETSNNFALSVIFDSLNFDASQINNVNILEWKKVIKERPIYEIVENCEYLSVIDNETGKATGNSTNCWSEQKIKGTETIEVYDWVKAKDVTAEQETTDVKKENYDSVVFDGRQDDVEKSVRYFKLSFDTPITKLPDGSFGSKGRVAFIEENSGKEYHPVWMTNYTYYYNGTIQSNAASTVTNLTHIINGSAGWYGNVIWCRNPAFLNNTMNGNFTFYENSTTDYRYVNASDNRELSCEVEKGNALNRTAQGGGAWDDSLTARWGLTNTMDSIGSRHLIINASTALNSSGIIGGGISSLYNGSGANFTDIDVSYTAITIMGWFRKYDNTTDQKLFGSMCGPNAEIEIMYYGTWNGWTGYVKTPGDHFTYKTQNAVVGEWTHVALRYDGDNLSLFIDGVPYSSIALTGSINDANKNWHIAGEVKDCDNYYYSGDADEARVYTGRNLSDAEIKAIYETQQYNYTMLGAKQASFSYATESQGDDAILQGIRNSAICPQCYNYSNQQVYTSNTSTNGQATGRFDWVAVNGSQGQTWAFNYLTLNDPTGNFTRMVNMTTAFYVWEAGNLSYNQIREQVTALINSTKI